MNKIEFGSNVDILKQWAKDGVKVQTCITSPPYFGLRSYLPEEHTDKSLEIGLEETPEKYIERMVEVFRAVRDVLADDGTIWVNIGDSYAAARGGGGFAPETMALSDDSGGKRGRRTDTESSSTTYVPSRDAKAIGVKNKDLIGIPWMLARALRDPYYTGPVKDVCDQVWLAAMLDAEGSICGTEYQSGDRIKTNIYISITNTSVPVIEKCDRLFPQEVGHVYEKVNGTSNRKCFRWDVERMDQKAMFLRTIYPHLVAKRKQAIIGYTFIEMQRGLVSKKKGYLAEQHEQRSWLMRALSLLNSGQDVDIPDWCVEPPSLFEPGYYLRQDIIWSKPNPMPESVKDRCTKSHEYIFLLSKKEKYYFDNEAIKEPIQHSDSRAAEQQHIETRNKRDVWSVATKPFAGAHFAVFPPALIEPCVLAGTSERGHCPQCGARWVRQVETISKEVERHEDGHGAHCPGNVPHRKGGFASISKTLGWVPTCECNVEPVPDIVLDTFMGSGTTAMVAKQNGRHYAGCELNTEYRSLQQQRINEPKEKTVVDEDVFDSLFGDE